jgi:uncharacterized protein (TIGR02099 family)
VRYVDQVRDRTWSFADVSARMNREAGLLKLEASALPPRELGSRIELTAQGAIEDDAGGEAKLTGDWRVFADLRDIDLAVAAPALPATAPALPQAGNGDVSLWLDWRASALASVAAEIALDDVVLPRVLGTAGSRYERIGLTGEWARTEQGWRVNVNDLAVTRAGRTWQARSATEIEYQGDADGPRSFALRSDFLRLEDLTPFLSPLPESRLLSAWFALAPRGDLSNTTIFLERGLDGWNYSIESELAGFGIEPFEEYPGFAGITGAVRADPRSGRFELRSGDSVLDWPALFRDTLAVEELSGVIVWRQGQDAYRVVGDDLVVATADGTARSSLELTVPLDDGAPSLDLTTTFSELEAVAVKRYLPVNKMPPSVANWLNDAIRGGRVHDARLTFVGPLDAFPFDGGEGELRVVAPIEQGVLAFVRDWPAAEELDGEVEFVNPSFAARGSGRILGNRTADVRVGISDMRSAVLTVQTQTIGPLDQVLAFLKGSPLIARNLGPDFARLEAPFGTGEASIDLSLPLVGDRSRYTLTAGLDIIDGELEVGGLAPHITEINGTLSLRDGKLGGEGIEAIFLDGPVTARVVDPELSGYRARLELEGEVTIDAVARTFTLPFRDRAAGQTRWQGSLLIPSHDTTPVPPARVIVASNLAGVALRFPAPFEKSPAEPTNLQLELAFASGGGLDVQGYLGATRRFAAQFDAARDRGYDFRRAALRFGGAPPEFRAESGATVDGSLPELDIDEWLALARGSGESRRSWDTGFAGATLEVADFSAFGQQLGASRVSARRRTDDWQIELDSDPIAGTILVPADLDRDPRIVAVMRLYLTFGGDEGGSAALRDLDPRKLPGLQLHSDEFAVGQRNLGRLDAEVVSDPLGLRLVSFESASAAFGAQGSGGWFVGADGHTTRFAVGINSSDVGAALRALGFDPIIEAKAAEITASVYWPGPPSGAWLEHLSGDLALRAEKGSLIDVQPGAGRMLGLLSISALPRRLAFDFRDVFNRGLVFDEITADFVIIDGDAYTDNLKLGGPAAEIGVVGRTGLRDRDYRQQAVVTAEPSKMLPTVGGLVGGPGVAAALLIFTRIFKKPLQGIGRASYCVTGTWAEPVVERLTDEQLEQGELCAELPPGATVPEEVAAR